MVELPTEWKALDESKVQAVLVLDTNCVLSLLFPNARVELLRGLQTLLMRRPEILVVVTETCRNEVVHVAKRKFGYTLDWKNVDKEGLGLIPPRRLVQVTSNINKSSVALAFDEYYSLSGLAKQSDENMRRHDFGDFSIFAEASFILGRANPLFPAAKAWLISANLNFMKHFYDDEPISGKSINSAAFWHGRLSRYGLGLPVRLMRPDPAASLFSGVKDASWPANGAGVRCKLFAQGGQCPYERCIYLHQKASQTNFQPTASQSCRFFKKGICIYGATCRYQH
jgi:predicted nucleic acid-binding protein